MTTKPTDLNQRPDGPPPPTVSRRDVLSAGALVGGAALLASAARATPARAAVTTPRDVATRLDPSHAPAAHTARKRAQTAGSYRPVTVPNGWTLPWKEVDGAKVFHMVAEEVDHEFAPGLRARCWGYNGSTHGPVIEAVEGDRLRIFVTNRLAAPTTVHWHGLILECGMDGVGGLTQRAIPPGDTFLYEFTLRQHGTFMYHSHHDEMTQMALGMTGLIVVHPRDPADEQSPPPDRDFAIMLHEWALKVGASRPDPNEMTDFNILTMNARAFPGTEPLVAKVGDRVRIRLGNLSAMDHHPIHLHGYAFEMTQTDGGVIPLSARHPETTVLVPTGSTRTVEFVADNPGDWAFHCHMTHHVMTQMGHKIPNTIGVDVGSLDDRIRRLLPNYMTMGQAGMGDMADMGMRMPPNSTPMAGGQGPHDIITMGGMFTILKVREQVSPDYADPGWYQMPPGTLADTAAPDTLRRNAIAPDASTAPRRPTARP